MVIYLIKRLIGVWLPLVFVMGFGPYFRYGVPLTDVLGKAMFWAGFVAAGYIYFHFRRRKTWPLYDNLQLSKLAILALFVCATTIVSFLPAFFR